MIFYLESTTELCVLYFEYKIKREFSKHQMRPQCGVVVFALDFFFKAYFIQNKNPGTKHNIQLERKEKQSYTVNTV